MELVISEMEKTLDFYAALGFELVWRADEPDGKSYAVVRHDAEILQLRCRPEGLDTHEYFGNLPAGPSRGYGVELVIHVANLDDMFRQMNDLDCVVADIRERPWGLRDFRVVDPSGYYLRITELHDVTAPTYRGRPRQEG